MLKYKVEIKGTEEVLKAIEKVESIINSKDLYNFIGEKALKVIKRIAEDKLKTGASNYNQHNKLQVLNNGILIYNDIANSDGTFYSLIIEYGSGTKMDETNAEHMGTTPEFLQSNYEWWYAGRHVKVHGQDPKYIYTDAAVKIEQNLEHWVSDYLSDKI